MGVQQASSGVKPHSRLADLSGGLLPNDRSIFWHLEQGAKISPQAPAVICMSQPAGHLSKYFRNHDTLKGNVDTAESSSGGDPLVITFERLLQLAKRVVAEWTGRGLKPGSTVLLCVPNGGQFCVLYCACILMRATVVCLEQSILAATAHKQLLEALRTLKPSVIVVENDKEAVATDIAIERLRMPQPLKVQLTEGHSMSTWESLDAFLRADPTPSTGQDMLELARYDDPERVHSVLFTSGTSGTPKGCPLRVAGQTHFLQSWSWLLDRRSSSRALQQAHNSRAIAPTQMLQTWSNGGAVILPSRSFHLDDTITAIEKLGATFIVLSPAMVHACADRLQPANLGSVSTVQIGGDAVTRTVLIKCQALFPGARICTHHGMSEGVAAFQWPFFDTPISRVPFMGETCPLGAVARGTRVRLWDAHAGLTARRGEPGELHVSSSSIIRHYLGGAQPDSFYDDADGRWFVTGDVAVMDESGTVYILGRAKDCIRRYGVTIMPGPVESVIEQYVGAQVSIECDCRAVQSSADPSFVQACVVGVPDARLGEATCAVVRDTNGKTKDDISRHVMSSSGQPILLDQVFTLHELGLNTFPINHTYKVVRSTLKEAVDRALKAKDTPEQSSAES